MIDDIVYDFAPLKNNNERTFRIASSVASMFKQVKQRQSEQKLRAGSSFQNKR